MVEGLVVGIERVRLWRKWGLGGLEGVGRGAETQRFPGVSNYVVNAFVTVLEPYRICSL